MRILTVLIACVVLNACASVVSGTQQSVFVDTPMMDGATCKLTDSKNGTWYLVSTPASVTVAKGNGPMNVVCEKAGYNTGVTSVDEEIAGAMWGNTIFWWAYIIDAATGAAQKYPDKVVVWMKPKEWKSPDEEASWNAEKRKFEEAQAKAKAKAEEEARQRSEAKTAD